MSARPRSLPAIPPAQLRPLRNRLRQCVRDAGLTDLSPSPETNREPFWQIEPTPLIIRPAEWLILKAAVRQRARLINAFLRDLYHRQEAMRDGLIPPEVTLADPYYRRPCLGLAPERLDPASLIRFDLIKTKVGWHFTATHTNTPVGLSYAVQNRRFLTQEATEFYRALPEYHSIINAPLQLVETLRRLCPSPARHPTMVFLTTGPHYPFFSEHSFLARKMGIRLAQGDDLLVLDNHVYFKTVAGLERVDVIYRRVNDAHIDPVIFATDLESAGIPGLMQCIRAGNVTMANAIGAGVAENRGLDSCLPRLSHYYLDEKLLLPSVPGYIFTDHDQIDAILDQADHLDLVRAHSSRIRPREEPLPQLNGRQLPQMVRENPSAFVARHRLASVSLTPGKKRAVPFRLSTFALTRGDQVTVLPGGLVNLGPSPHPPDRIGLCADVIVLAGDRDTSGNLADLERPGSGKADVAVPGSRAAESLFWLGRYLERAEATARMLSMLDDVALEEIPAADRPRWLPLWRGLLAATGHDDQKISARAHPQTTWSQDLIWRMTLGSDHPSSLLNTVGAAADNARRLRDFVSPEAGNILTRIELKLREAARQSPPGRLRSDREARNRTATIVLTDVLVEINACLGSTARTMLQDAGWHFMQLGQHLERATLTTNTLRHVLIGFARPVTERDLTDADLIYRDNPELSALLRMLGSQDAYRRLFRTRSQPLFTAQLLIQQAKAPRSILHNLQQMQTSLDAIHASDGADNPVPASELIRYAIHEISALRLDRYFDADVPLPPGEPDLQSVLDGISERFIDLHGMLGDHYFSHQARLERRESLGEPRS